MNTNVAYPHYCRSCPCDRHDLYLPSIPVSLQTLGRCECVSACAIGCNHMHLVGASLCVLLHRCEQQEFDLRAALGHAAGRVLLSEKPLRAYGIDDLLSLVTAPQSHPRSSQTLGPLLRIHICRYRYTYI